MIVELNYVYIYKKLQGHFPEWLLNFTFTGAMHESSSCSFLLVLSNVSIICKSVLKNNLHFTIFLFIETNVLLCFFFIILFHLFFYWCSSTVVSISSPLPPLTPAIPTSHPWSYTALALSMGPLYIFLDDPSHLPSGYCQFVLKEEPNQQNKQVSKI